MRKIYMWAAVSVLVGAASGAQAIDSTGCGLGSMAWRGVSGPEAQVLAVTTNTSTGSQTFGITFGTSGCDPQGRVTGGTQRMVFDFIQNNMEQYALDAARGEGENAGNGGRNAECGQEDVCSKITAVFCFDFSRRQR